MGGHQVRDSVSEKACIPDRESVSVLHGGNDSCQGKIWKERGLDDGEETQKEGKSKEKKRKERCG